MIGYDVLTASLAAPSIPTPVRVAMTVQSGSDGRTDPLQGTSGCPGCTADTIAASWAAAAAGDPGDSLYKRLSDKWAGMHLQHTHTAAAGGGGKP